MRLFHGKPLLFYTIDQALKSRTIDEVYVSTDSPEIKEYSEACGAKVPFLRPKELCGDDVHASVPILHMLEQLGGATRYGYCVQLLASSPLKTAQTIDEIVNTSKRLHLNVLSVTPTGRTPLHLRTRCEDGTLRCLTNEVTYNFQTQDLPEVFAINGAIYCATVEPLLAHRTFQYGHPYGFPMDQIEALDIDTETDFLIADRLADLVIPCREGGGSDVRSVP